MLSANCQTFFLGLNVLTSFFVDNLANTTHMMTSSNGDIFRITDHLCGEFTGHQWIPYTKASDVELWCFLCLHLNKRLSKQSWGWWFEMPSRPLWRHCNEIARFMGPTWVLSAPGGSHVSPMNLAIRAWLLMIWASAAIVFTLFFQDIPTSVPEG